MTVVRKDSVIVSSWCLYSFKSLVVHLFNLQLVGDVMDSVLSQGQGEHKLSQPEYELSNSISHKINHSTNHDFTTFFSST